MSHIKEAIRQINNSIQYKKSSIIAFSTLDRTNSQATLIANMAIMYAQAGEKTVIIDTDFSSNVFLKVFQLLKKEGLSDLLDGNISDEEDVINRVSGQNVSVITSGTLSVGNTKYLVGDPKFKRLLENLCDEYDKILINTRIFDINDNEGKNIYVAADGVIIVTDIRKTLKKEVLRMINYFRKNKVEVLGYISAKKE